MATDNNGWVKIHRKIQDNDLWLCEPFSKAQAWIDLIFLANHKDGGFFVRGNWVAVKRGEVGYSKESLAVRWKWSRNKVLRFISLLENRGQVEQHKNFILSLISIKNYNQYQDNGTADETTERQQKDSRRHTNKNDKNDKNDKNKEREGQAPPSPQVVAKDFFENIQSEHRVELYKVITAKGVPEELAKSELRKFVAYWTEPNKSGTRRRWEMERTFELSRRIFNWFSKIKEFAGPVNHKGKEIIY